MPSHRDSRISDAVSRASAERSEQDRKDKREAVRRGLKQLDAGKGIPLEDIEAWVESWDTPDELPPPGPRS